MKTLDVHHVFTKRCVPNLPLYHMRISDLNRFKENKGGKEQKLAGSFQKLMCTCKVTPATAVSSSSPTLKSPGLVRAAVNHGGG